MPTNIGLFFNAATGTWDTQSDWKAENFNGNVGEVPTSSSPVSLTSSVQHLTAGGSDDRFSTIQATGSLAGGGGNTLDVTGTLTGFNGGVNLFEDFTLRIEEGARFVASQLSLSNSLLDISGNASLTNGGGLSETNSTIVIETGGTLSLSELDADKTDTLVVDGFLNLTGGGPGLGGNNTVNTGGTVNVSGFEDTGSSWVINGGTFHSDTVFQNGQFTFTGTNGVLDLSNDSIFNADITVTGFNNTDKIILNPVTGTSTVSAAVIDNTLEVFQNGQIVSAIDHFTLAQGATLGVEVVDGHYVVEGCFYAGTRLATAQGDIAVEDIEAGALLKTLSGELKSVRWLGRSVVSTRFADPLRVLPIRITAGALGGGLPVRDLLVSPCHAIFIGGVLIHAGALVNGVTILREANVPEIFTYYHVELAGHELLLAEGAAAESFIDNVDRMNFVNWAEHEALGELPPIEEMPYPRAKAHRQVPAAVRRMLAVRPAGSMLAQAA